MTELFETILSPTRLRSTQVAVPVALGAQQKLIIAGLAGEIVMAPSMLSRNVRLLKRDELMQLQYLTDAAEVRGQHLF